jgi:hypothetical protein
MEASDEEGKKESEYPSVRLWACGQLCSLASSETSFNAHETGGKKLRSNAAGQGLVPP